MMEERRNSTRWEINNYPKYQGDECFRIVDISTNRSIGKLVDISADGMRIVSNIPLEKGARFKFRIDLPREVGGCDQLNVSARNVWCREDDELNSYQAGFEFQSTFPHHADIIELLFNDLASVIQTEL